MNGILETLHKLLQMRDPGLERTELIGAWPARRRPRALICLAGDPTNLPDSRDQSFMLWHSSRPTVSLGVGLAGRVPAPFLGGHLADHQRATLDLLADERELLGPLRLSPLARRRHPITSPGKRHSRLGAVASDGEDPKPQ